MSPRLLFLLTTQRTHHRLERDRDRIDARPAPDPVDLLPLAA